MMWWSGSLKINRWFVAGLAVRLGGWSGHCGGPVL